MKTKTKRQWTQFVAVAAAAVCAVTATCAGVTINHADAADSYVAYLNVQDAYYAVNAYDESFGNSVELTGDGTYSVSVVNENTYASGAWEKFNIVLFEPQNEDLYTADNVTVDSVVIGDTTYDTVEYTVTGGQYSQNAAGAWPYSAVVAITATDFTTLAVGETVTVNFTIGEASEETTTTTEVTTTTVSSEEEETTTTVSSEEEETTTTVSSEEEETTTTTVSSEEEETTTTTVPVTTTTTTESTTKATTTTTASTTKATTTTSVTLETAIDFTQEKESDGDGGYNAFVEFDPKGADRVRVVIKVSSSDTQATISYGCWNNTDEKWYDDENLVDIPTDKIITYTDVVPAKVDNTLKISVYYPKAASVTFQSVTLIYDEAPVVTTTKPFESDLTFTEVAIDADNKTDMLNKCYINVTLKGVPGYTVTGGIYAGDLAEEWERTIGDDQTATVGYEIRGESLCNFKAFYYGLGTTSYDEIEMNISTYYEGDASLNGKVNGSDVLAIIRYITATSKNDIQDVVCDHDDNGKVAMADAISLTKTLLAAK